MHKRFIAPALADLRQDIAGTMPLDLIREWTDSTQDDAAQSRILAPYLREGTLVSTDSCGLSKLCRERSLLEVLRLVSRPKEIIHSHGTAAGGEAVGIWAADNSEMFYHRGIPIKNVMNHLIAAQREIAGLEVHIGAAVHTGEFFLLGGGAFGPDAAIVEQLAEDFTAGGEIAVTSTVRDQLQQRFQSLRFTEKRLPNLRAWRCEYGDVSTKAVRGKNERYPYPFTAEFFDFVTQGDILDATETDRILSKYGTESVVILVKIHSKPSEYLLQQLATRVIAKAMIADVAREDGVRSIKNSGSLGIFLTEDAHRALEFARNVTAACVANGYEYNIGIACGEVLVFPMDGQDPETEIAGEPVNLASKIAEDIDERNSIYIEDSAAALMKFGIKCEPFRFNISHIEITGMKTYLPQRQHRAVRMSR